MEASELPSLKAAMLDKDTWSFPLCSSFTFLSWDTRPLLGVHRLFGIILVSSLKKSTRMGIRDVIAALDSGTRVPLQWAFPAP